MRYKIPQNIKIILNKKYPSLEVEGGILINGISAWFTPDIGYHLKFNLYFKVGEFEFNIVECKLLYKGDGIVWQTPTRYQSGNRCVEFNMRLYRAVLDKFLEQPYIDLIGRGKLSNSGATVEVPELLQSVII